MNFYTHVTHLIANKHLNFRSLLLLMFMLSVNVNTISAESNNPLKPTYAIGYNSTNLADLGVLVASQPSYTTCATSFNGELRAIGFNGEAPYSYLWSNGATTSEVDGLGLGTYTVTITDSNNETASASGEITLHPEGVWIMITATGACDGGNNGTAYASAMLGTEPYTYEWSDGQTGPEAIGLAQGNYTVTATDAFGCSNEERIFVSGGQGLDIFLTSTYETCLGSNDAKITAVVSGGQEPYSYEWSDGQTTQIATGFGAGQHSVTVTDALGCSSVATETVELSPEGLWIMLSATDANCGQDDGTIHVGVMTGVAPYDFMWSDPSIGNTGDPVDVGAGTYSVTVSDANGCTAVDVITVNSTDQIDISTSSTNATCDNGGTATVTISSGTGPFDISWSNGDSGPMASDLDPGVYTVEVTDANGCFGSGTVLITDTCDPCDADAGTLTPSGNPSGCISGSTNISATANGNSVVPAGYETIYVLTAGNGLVIQAVNGSPSFDVTAAGVYTIHTLVYDPNTLDLNIVDFGVTTGFDVNALLIQGGGDICASLDVNGADFNLDQGILLSIIPQNPSICPGESIDFTTTASSPDISFAWTNTGGTFNNPSSDSPTYTMMMPGTYDITVVATDLNTGCEGTATTTVTVLANPDITIAPENSSVCVGQSVSFSASGVPANSTYSWTASGGTFDNATSGVPTWTMMMPGTYTINLSVSTPDGCTVTTSTTATILANPDITIVPEDPSVCAGQSVSFTANGVPASSTYSWTASGGSFDNPSSEAPTWTMMMPGTYTISLSITTADGCTGTASTTATINAAPTACSATVTSSYNEGTDISIRNGNDGTASASAGGGGSFTYLWSNGATTQEASNLSAGTYTVEITNADGCSCNASVTLEDPAKLGNYVWHDENRNGIQDAGENGIEGVKVTLNGTTVGGLDIMRMMNTGPDGMYMFDGLLPGSYKVTFGTPVGYTPTLANQGGDDDADSDADPITGMTQMVDLEAGDYNPTLDGGFYLCTNVGNYVWWDSNHNGLQDIDEEGVPGVQVKLLRPGFDGVYCTPDDWVVMETTTGPNGEYLFHCVEPGEYVISFMNLPAEWQFTDQNVGNDELDSDADPSKGATVPFTVTSGQPDILTIDAGIRPICDNFNSDNNGGLILNSPAPICIGETPFSFVSVEEPIGGSGPIEIIWMYTTDPGPWSPPAGFTIIPGATDWEYSPGPLFETTSFIRCSRRAGCTVYRESNVVTIVVEDCPGPSMFQTNLNGSLDAYDNAVLDWSMDNELVGYNYLIQKSYDGVKFFDLGLEVGKGDTGTKNTYNYMDANAKSGMNHYRIKIEEVQTGAISFSNIVALEISEQILVDAFPNPFIDRLILTPKQKLQDDLQVDLYNITGQLVYSQIFDKDSDIIEIFMNEKEHDVRNLIVRLSHANNSKSKVIRVIQLGK